MKLESDYSKLWISVFIGKQLMETINGKSRQAMRFNLGDDLMLIEY